MVIFWAAMKKQKLFLLFLSFFVLSTNAKDLSMNLKKVKITEETLPAKHSEHSVVKSYSHSETKLGGSISYSYESRSSYSYSYSPFSSSETNAYYYLYGYSASG